MRWPAFWGIAGLVAAAATTLAIALPHNGYQRYQSFGGTMFERLRWVYERIHFDPAPVDVVVLGASREGISISPSLVEQELVARGLPWRVANFSLAAGGMDVRLTMLNELLRQKRPKLVIISVTEQLPRDGHQAFGPLATPGELLSAPWLVNQKLPENLARLPIRQMQLALMSRDPEGFGQMAAFDPLQYEGTSPDLTPAQAQGGAALRRNLTPEELAANSAMRRRQIRPPILPDQLGDIEFGVSRHYLGKMAAVARANGAEVRFIFLPFYRGHERPLDAGWIEGVAPIFYGTQWINDPTAYRDEGHLRRDMRPAVAQWLADEIAATEE